MNIVVLTGGISEERDICLATAKSVSNALIANGHSIKIIDLFIGLDKLEEKENFFKKVNTLENDDISVLPPNIEEVKKLRDNPNELIGPNVLEACKMADLVFLALHGGLGEDGKIQTLLELYDIKYTGSNSLQSAICMDKHLTKLVLKDIGVNVAEWVTIRGNNYDVDHILTKVNLPVVVKPTDNGSSVGVYMCDTKEELAENIVKALEVSNNVMIEERIIGKEINVGILDGKALPPIEIITESGFFDYESKYQIGGATEVCPAEISEKDTKAMMELAEYISKSFALEDYSRIDFFLKEDSTLIGLEVNTLPGMTQTSLLPQEAAAAGISFNELCETICKLAYNK